MVHKETKGFMAIMRSHERIKAETSDNYLNKFQLSYKNNDVATNLLIL